MTKKALAEKTPALLRQDNPQNMLDLMELNLGGDGLGEFDLERVKVPSGGGTMWEVPGFEGTEAVKELRGIIVHWKPTRSYWKGEYTGEIVPPDCYSNNGVQGFGDPGGLCADCEFSKYGSAPRGGGQACKAMRTLFILMDNELLPIVLNVPPTSIGNIKKYFVSLVSRGISFYQVYTKLVLVKDKSQGGIEYSKIEAHAERKLDENELRFIEQYMKLMKSSIERVNTIPGFEKEDDPLDDTDEDAVPDDPDMEDYDVTDEDMEEIEGEDTEGDTGDVPPAEEPFSLEPDTKTPKELAHQDWSHRIPTKKEALEIHNKGCSRAYYVFCRQQWGEDEILARARFKRYLNIPQKEDVKVSELIGKPEIKKEINMQVFEESGKVLYE